MAVLLRLLFFIVLFSLFRYLLRGLLGGASRARRPAPPSAPQPGVPRVQTGHMMRDPLCGTFVAEELSLKVRLEGQTLHFCSEECRQGYLAALEQPRRSHAR